MLEIFKYNNSNVRVVIDDEGEPWFVAKDVCEILELGNSREALARLDEDEKNTVSLNDGTPGNPNLAIINESGLYALILGSRKPEAKRFKRWATHEVFPSIRKHGFYGTGKFVEQALADPSAWITMLTKYNEEKKKREKIEEERMKLEAEKRLMLPKVEFFDTVADSKDCIPMGGMSRVLNRKDIGRNRLYSFLRSQGILMGRPNMNLPYQTMVEREYFRVVEKSLLFPGFDQPKIHLQTYVSPKGQLYIQQLVAAKYDDWNRLNPGR